MAIKNSTQTQKRAHPASAGSNGTDEDVKRRRIKSDDTFSYSPSLSSNVSNPTEPNVRVAVKPDETIESLLRRFNREVQKVGLLRRMRELEFYEKPSVKKKREKVLRERRIKDYERWAE